ncbi:MAG: glutathione S-transferase family protein [Gloeomargaritaceae cyanobacterium C42_A2020_066]|nr:glutathione S-transferase family protein [Gloeomargaritaceae cyanobacterium C42_A2020_066]
MLTLYQFELSAYCEKVRLILDYKGLAYRKQEVVPGLGQMEVLQLSGQRQVPVLKDGDTVIPDSTAIALYLERQYPGRPLLPDDAYTRGLCLCLEAWADEVLMPKVRRVFVGALTQDAELRLALLPQETPDPLRVLVGGLPADLWQMVGSGVGLGIAEVAAAKQELREVLARLSGMLAGRPYLLGDSPTLADLTVASLTLTLKFPALPYLNLPAALQGKGIAGIADDPTCAPFFVWRDQIYQQFRRLVGEPPAGPTAVIIE